VRQLFARAQVVVLATRPNVHASGMTVALEAMSCGRPVVACATPGMDEYVVPGRTGHLVPTSDAVAMATQVLALLDDADAAATLGRQGREHVTAHHTTRTMCAALLDVVGGV
jgi:glycosyltransferase involved in cell wall biosynthesis